MKKRIVSLFLCIAMVFSLMPFTAFATPYDECSLITVVNLSGAQAVENLNKIPSHNQVVPIANGGDGRYRVDSVSCVETNSGTLYTNDPLCSGVSYYLDIVLVPNDGYSFPFDISDEGQPVSVTMDGLAVESEDYYSYMKNGSRGERSLKVKYHFTVPGEPVEYLNHVELTVLEKPIYGVTALYGSDACVVPEDAPYEISTAVWRYRESNGGWAPSQNFRENGPFQLWVNIEPKEDSNIRFITSPKINLNGFTDCTYTRSIRDAEGICYLYLQFDVEYPPTHPLTFDPCGGTFPDGSTEIFTGHTRLDGGASHYFSEMKRSGYNFKGWYSAPVGGEKIPADTKFYVPTTVYAQWTPCIDEVFIENFIPPTAGKAPVFTAKVPDGAQYTIAEQLWDTGSGEDTLRFTTSLAEMSAMKTFEQEYGKDFILRTFESSKVYNYSIQLKAADGLEFGKETTVHFNGTQRVIHAFSDTLDYAVTFDCSAPNAFVVYDGAVVKSGVCGTAIETVDLNNFVRAKTACTFTAASGKPSWLNLSSNGRLTGTRPSSAQAATSFTVNVFDGNTTKVMTVSVEPVTTQWVFVTQPQNFDSAFCDSQIYFVAETTAENPTYSWQMYEPNYKQWLPMSSLATMLSLDYMEAGSMMAFMVSEDNPVDFTGCQFRCRVTADGVSQFSSAAKLSVEHRYTACVPTNGNNDTHTYTCAQCGAVKHENHLYRYAKTAITLSGKRVDAYRKICVLCGHSSAATAYTVSDSQKVALTLNFNGGDVPSATRTVLVTQYASVRPYSLYPVRDGYVFEGWALTKDADEALFGPDSNVFAADNMTLYAVWSPLQVVVNGTYVTLDNMNDVLGDGTVSLQLPTATHKAVLTLNGADLQVQYINGINRFAAIYAAHPLEITMTGSPSTITVVGGSAVGILSSSDINLSGTKLAIAGNTSYVAGIEAATLDIGVGSLTIQDARYGISGDAEFYNGNTYLSAGKYTGSDYRAVSGHATVYEYYHPVIRSAAVDGQVASENTLANAVYMRNMQIEEPGNAQGDVDGNGQINSDDLIRLKQFLLTFDPQTGTSAVEISAGADANIDDTIDVRDLVKLKKILAQ